MSATAPLARPVATAAPSPIVRTAVRRDLRARMAGLGGIAFAAIVVVQNVIRGSSAPSNGADAEEVLAHYADHRAVTIALVATFVVAGLSLATFLGGVLRRLFASERRGWAIVGGVGGVGVMALFSIVVGIEQALSVVAHRGRGDLGAVEALWALHNGVFAVLYLSLALALLGLGRAGVAAGTTPAIFERLAPVGAALLVVAAVTGPWTAAGEAMAFFALGGLGFLTWLAFLVTTGLRLVRSEGADERLAVATA